MNYIAIIVAVIASIVIGFLWYGPVFGKLWMNLMGFTKKDIDSAKKKEMGKSYFFMIIGTLVTAYVLSMLMDLTGSVGYVAGAILSFWIWIGFVATTTLSSVIWEGKSWKLWFLNNAHTLVSLLVMGLILGAWV